MNIYNFDCFVSQKIKMQIYRTNIIIFWKKAKSELKIITKFFFTVDNPEKMLHLLDAMVKEKD